MEESVWMSVSGCVWAGMVAEFRYACAFVLRSHTCTGVHDGALPVGV